MKNILLISLMLLLSSCYTKKKCQEKFCQDSTITVIDTFRYVDTIYTKPDTAFLSVLLDSLVVDSLYTILDSREMTIRLLRYKNNQLNIETICKGDTVYIDTTLVKQNTITIKVPVPCDEKALIKKGREQGVKWTLVGVLVFIGIGYWLNKVTRR